MRSKILPIVIVLLFIGLIFVSLSSLNEASNTVGDKFFFLKKQLVWIVVSLVMTFVIRKVDLAIIRNNIKWFYLGVGGLLLLIFVPGMSNETLGAKRWLDLGITSIQPSELFKLAIVLFLPLVFEVDDRRNVKSLLSYLVVPLILIVLEPNLSTAILIALISISIYYLSGGKLTELFGLITLIGLISLGLILTSPYRLSRFNSLINPAENQDTAATYHSRQIVLSLASGGLFGKGLGNSDQKYSFVPKLSTDSVVAIVGEEMGFIGVVLLIMLYLMLVNALFKIAKKLKDPYEILVVYGLACWIAYQSIINLAAITAIIPLTGVPLPFVSYGGSSLTSLMFAVGVVLNIERRRWALLYSVSEENKKDRHNRDTLNSGN